MRAPSRRDLQPYAARSRNGHPGLRFFKHIDAWSDRGWTLAPDAKRKYLQDLVDWNESLRRPGGYGRGLLDAVRSRFQQHTAMLSGEGYAVAARTLATSWRLVTGLGISHPFETGFLFHHTWGVPYLPSSGVKGATSAWLEESAPHIWDARRTDIFGQPRDGDDPVGGSVIFFDALPTTWPKIEIDIMNPHYGEYYAGQQPPADWLNPNPVHFLAIAPEQPFEFTVAVRPDREAGRSSDAQELLTLAIESVAGAAQAGGLGGKSAVGYGYFQ